MICNRLMPAALSALLGLQLGSCAFEAKPAPVAAVNVFQSYDSKVPGRWALHVDGSAFKREATIIGHVCSAHRFPFDAVEPFKASVVTALRNVLDDVVVTDTLPSPATLRQQRLAGVIRVQAETLNARIGFLQQTWSGQATARVDMVANTAVDGASGRLLGTSVEGTGASDRSGGCPDGAAALADASEQAMKRLVTSIAERIANSPRVREAARAARR